MSYKVLFDSTYYECQMGWSEGCTFQIKDSEINYRKDRSLLQKTDIENKFMFASLCPAPENIIVTDVFVLGKWQRPKVWMVGRGRSIGEAESAAFEQYAKAGKCDHKFSNKDDSDLSGDGVCKTCGIFVTELFLHPNIRSAKYKALARHGNQTLFGDVMLKNHLMSMTQEMIFDPHLSPGKKVDFVCAGWLHHTNGDINSTDNVDQILKFFHLDPSAKQESMILQYYDIVDTIKYLLVDQNQSLLEKTLQESKDLLISFERYSMPHAHFLTSYILMCEQAILVANSLQT